MKKRSNIIRPSLRATSKLATSPPTQVRSERPKPLHHRLWAAVVVIATMVGLVGGIDYFFGRPWPTDPEIHAVNAVGDSSLVLPFTIRNKSLFPMNNVAMTCGVDLVAFEDARGKRGGVEAVAFYTGVISIGGNSTINYPCDASSLVQVKPDGTFNLRDTLSSNNAPFQPPLKIVKMCIWVGGDYTIGPKLESFTSILFKWPASQTNKQWVEGPTAIDQDRPKRMPSNNFDDLECRDSVSGPYVYIKGFGQPLLLLDVSKRPRA